MSSSSFRFFQFAAPARFYGLAGALIPWCWAAFAALAAIGLWIGFFVAPTDATQGDAYRIIFIHVPAAWMSMLLYLVMAFWAAIGWAFNARLASMTARAIAPTGRDVHLPRPLDRRALGQADLGHLVGLGRAAHLGADPAVPLRRLSLARLGDRRPAPRRPRRRAAGDRRQHQRADHLLLGEVVEHPAPGRDHQRHRRAENGKYDADCHAPHDPGLLGLRLRRRLHPGAGDRPRARPARGWAQASVRPARPRPRPGMQT
jgi:hypothetical protein